MQSISRSKLIQTMLSFVFPVLLATSTCKADPPAAGTTVEKPILGTVLGNPVYASELNENVDLKVNLHRLFLRPLEVSYLRKQRIDPTHALKQHIGNVGNVRTDGMAFTLVRMRVLHAHLFQRHGGRVQLDAFGAFAYDGYRKWLEERERAGDFTLSDPKHRALLFLPLSGVDQSRMTEDPEIIRQAFDQTLRTIKDRKIESRTSDSTLAPSGERGRH